MSGMKLRPHQVEAVDAIVRALEFSPGREVPPEGLRATVVSATGSGKTITAAKAALRLEPHGRVLVMVPTLDLLTQTVEAWRAAGHHEPMVAVCSLGRDELLDSLGVRSTTNPIRLALWAGNGPATVFATYASLTPQTSENGDGDGENEAQQSVGVLEAAFRGSYGQALAPFGLVVVDEAHRTSGDAAKPWAAIHDNARIPAARRLYMTATPRVWALPEQPGTETGQEASVEAVEGSQGGGEGMPERLVASMSDEAVYGSRCHTLSLTEAIDRGILARFEIDVLEIRDPEQAGAGAEEVRGRRLAALQAALLEHTANHDLATVLVFHGRVLEARAFAAKLPETAARLYEADPEQHMSPHRVWAGWLCGEHAPAHRREVLGQFADGLDQEGRTVNRALLSSVRILGEGVDIVGRRGVQAVAYADVRGSAVDIVQGVGRGLRQSPGEGKIARLIVPVFLQPGEDPQDMLASASFAPLVAILEGLRAHDAELVEQLATRQVPSRSSRPSILGNGGQEQDGGAGEGGGRVESPLLRFSTPRDPELIAQFLRTRVIRPESHVWLAGLNALRKWREGHGHARVPLDTKVSQGHAGGVYPLGGWVSEMRRAYTAGTLKQWRIDLLDELGMVWSAPELAWEENLAALRAYHAAHGHLAAPRSAVAEGRPVGQLLTNLRRPGGLGKNPHRATERAADLAAIDPDWNPGWSLVWQRQYAALRMCLDGGAGLAEILPGVTVDGQDIGLWLRQQISGWEQLTDGQRERLEALGVQPAKNGAEPAAGNGKPAAWTVVVPNRASAWEKGAAAVRQYRNREGHVRIPRKAVEIITDEDGREHVVKAGVWISNQKSRRAALAQERVAVLAELGVL